MHQIETIRVRVRDLGIGDMAIFPTSNKANTILSKKRHGSYIRLEYRGGFALYKPSSYIQKVK